MPQTLIIEDKLIAWAAALPLVASRAGGRVFPWSQVPQGGPFPYVLLQRVGGGRMRSLKGTTTRVSKPRLQWDVIARQYADAREIGEALHLALEHLQQTTLDGIKIQYVCVKDARELSADPVHGDGVYEPRYMIDSELWFEEGV